jgi:hypothetical protein
MSGWTQLSIRCPKNPGVVAAFASGANPARIARLFWRGLAEILRWTLHACLPVPRHSMHCRPRQTSTLEPRPAVDAVT